jgi:uncharacterized protein YdhG (YjbR/CyaY superfamily)
MSAIDDYMGKFPEDVRSRLERLRSHVAALLPGAEEKISYGIPTFKLGKNIFHFGAYPGHIGLYPGPEAIKAHAADLTAYKTSKGAIQIPHDVPLPLELVTHLVEFNLSQLPAASKPARPKAVASPGK